ncbi:MAG TPA: diguanylate cyclase [Rhodanobacteraceae bacterium]|nr:diguanylate cyclase [Rhodanobacteraceae bacterium]
MNDSGDRRNVVSATEMLVALDAQAVTLREHLAKLRQDLINVQRELNTLRENELREANESLVLAVLKADSIAAMAVDNLSRLTHTSQRDPLTCTPNRTLMRDRLDTAIAAAHRQGSQLAVLFLDLDHFKTINDTLGHINGDQVLQLVAERLTATVRDSDTVSRYGGDEFLILLPQIAEVADAGRIAAKLLAAVAAPAHVGDHVLQLTASLGVAVYPQDGKDAEVLTKRADTAMYYSKHHSHGGFAFYADCIAGKLNPLPQSHDWRRVAERLDFSPDVRAAERHHLRRANQQLVLSALNAQASAAQAIEAHRQQIRFMGLVAHELRNPLAPIRLAAEMLAHGVQPKSPSLAELNTVIETQVAHMTRLIDDLLEGSRISAGKMRLEFDQVDLREVLTQVVKTCQPMMEVRQQRLTVALPAESVNLHGDRVRLTQIVNNLLDNASKYTGEGGTITLTMTVQQQAATITVSDNGVGIAPEMLPDIFDMFVQDTRDHQLSNGGLGIGLAVVRELVQAHGGRVNATSAGKNRGSCFIVALPVVTGKA